jgi:hypothetical protein
MALALGARSTADRRRSPPDLAAFTAFDVDLKVDIRFLNY